jgi:hypothetical protein
VKNVALISDPLEPRLEDDMNETTDPWMESPEDIEHRGEPQPGGRVKKRMAHFGRTPSAMLRSNGVSMGAKALYATLDNTAPLERVTYAKLRVVTGWSLTTLTKHLAELELAGWLTIKSTYYKDGGRGANDYTLASDEPGGF